MKRRYLWACILGVVGGYIGTKGESLLSEPVLLGLIGGAILGLIVGLLVEKLGRKRRRALQLKQKQEERAGIQSVNLKLELDDWLRKQNFKTVSFKENQNPLNEPTADYRVVYEARFMPDSTSQAGLELTLTDNGYLGVGIETRERMAERLKVRNSRAGFADGFEPSLMDVRALLLLLDVVSAGELVIQARILPWHGLGQTRAITTSTRQGADAVFARFYFASSLRIGLGTKTVTFGPWD